jgi:hypothetical protein
MVIYGYVDHVDAHGQNAHVWFKPDRGFHVNGMVDAVMLPELADGLPPNLYMAYDCVVLCRVLGNVGAGDLPRQPPPRVEA